MTVGDVEVYYDDGWHVRTEGTDHVSFDHDTQHQAVKTGRCLATYVGMLQLPPSRRSIDLIVRDIGGHIIRRTRYPVVADTGATGGEHLDVRLHAPVIEPSGPVNLGPYEGNQGPL